MLRQKSDNPVSWEKFQLKYGTPSNITRTMPSPEITPMELQQVFGPNATDKETFELTAEMIKDEEIRTLLNHNKVKISTNVTALNELKALMENGGLVSEGALNFFDDHAKFLSAYALTLYVLGRINNNDLIDLISHAQILRDKDIEIYGYFPVIDANGNYTASAKAYLLPVLKQQTVLYRALDDSQIESLRLMLSKMPNPPCIAVTSRGYYERPKSDDLMGYLMNSFPDVPFSHVVQFGGETCFLEMNRNLMEAYYLTYYGEHTRKSLFVIGLVTKEVIEKGVHQLGIRYGTLTYDGIVIGSAHPPLRQTGYGLFKHDIFHYKMLNDTPEFFLNAINRILNYSRIAYETKWSKELWSYAESDFGFFIQHDMKSLPNQPEAHTRVFYQALDNLVETTEKLDQEKLTAYYQGPRNLLLLINLAANPKIWLRWNIDADYLPEIYKKNYQLIKEILPNLVGKSAKLCYAMCLVYMEIGSGELWDKFKEAIHNNAELYNRDLKFARIKSTTRMRNNTLEFRFQHIAFSPITFAAHVTDQDELHFTKDSKTYQYFFLSRPKTNDSKTAVENKYVPPEMKT